MTGLKGASLTHSNKGNHRSDANNYCMVRLQLWGHVLLVSAELMCQHLVEKKTNLFISLFCLKAVGVSCRIVFKVEATPRQPFDYNGKLSHTLRVGKTQMTHFTYSLVGNSGIDFTFQQRNIEDFCNKKQIKNFHCMFCSLLVDFGQLCILYHQQTCSEWPKFNIY